MTVTWDDSFDVACADREAGSDRGDDGHGGRVVWVAKNPLRREKGVPDSLETGMTYLQSLVGDPDEPSSHAGRHLSRKGRL